MKFQIIFDIKETPTSTAVTKQINLGDAEHPSNLTELNALLLALAGDPRVVTPQPIKVFSY